MIGLRGGLTSSKPLECLDVGRLVGDVEKLVDDHLQSASDMVIPNRICYGFVVLVVIVCVYGEYHAQEGGGKTWI